MTNPTYTSRLHLHLPSSPSHIVYRDLLGWEPKIPLAEGLAKTIEYFHGF